MQNTSANGFRLPTEVEWEYAARGGQNYTYSGSNNLDEVGWCEDNSGNRTHPVAQKKSNGYGLYDMSGNVWEWCWGVDDPKEGNYRYYRGGSYGRCDRGLGSSYGGNCEVDNGDDYFANYQINNVGFRIVCNVD